MSLDFYRAKAKDDIDFDTAFVGLDEELQEYLYKKRDLINFDVKYIYEIDPYSDTELNAKKIKEIIEVCGKLKESEYLVDYHDEEEAEEIFTNLEKLCREALECNQIIFAIGD